MKIGLIPAGYQLGDLEKKLLAGTRSPGEDGMARSPPGTKWASVESGDKKDILRVEFLEPF